LFQLAENLLKRETLNHDEVAELLGPPPHGPKKLLKMIEFGPATAVEEASGESPVGEDKPPPAEEHRSQAS